MKPLIWIESVIERHAHSRVEYMVKAKSQFKRRSTANNVEIIIPVPNDADSPKFKTSVGSVKYTPEKNCIVWTIKSFPVCIWLSSYLFYLFIFFRVSKLSKLLFVLYGYSTLQGIFDQQVPLFQAVFSC